MKESQNSLIIIGSIIVILIVGSFLVYPQFSQIKDLKTQVAAKSQEADQAETKVNNLTALTQEIKSNVDAYSKLKIAMPTEPKIEEAFIMLNTMANNAGVTLGNIQQKTEKQNTGPLVLTVSATGDFNAQIKFVENLRTNSRPIIVTNATLTAQETKDTGNGKKTTLSGTYDISLLVANSSSATATTVNPAIAAPVTSSTTSQ